MADLPNSDSTPSVPQSEERRDFLTRAASIFIGGAIVTVPAAAGVAVFVSPLFRKAEGGITVKLTALENLPENGKPQQFSIAAEKVDAWTRYQKKGVGIVWLRRKSGREVEAFNASCPHAGCAVKFDGAVEKYNCPCHQSLFELDGSISTASGKKSPAARGMDALEVDVRDDGAVWVNFVNFKAGIADKVAVV
jgi:menaquinol-cytochrome c reductase iron-sulfur subunit